MSTRHLEKFQTPPEKYHLYRKNLTPPEIILPPLKFLNPHPRKFLNPFRKFLTPPPENFSTPPKISQPPPKKKFLNHPRKFLNPRKKISEPPPENFSTPPLKISQPHSKKYQPQKYVKRYPPPPTSLFFLFLHFSKKSLKISGGGCTPRTSPPLNTPLPCLIEFLVTVSIHEV